MLYWTSPLRCKASISDIKIDSKDRAWLVLRRTKTDNLIQVPLLPMAVNLIKKYESDRTRVLEGRLVPFPCNQVLNRNLKDLMKAVNIEKRISSHSGRYTFASTVLLGNGVKSKQLGLSVRGLKNQ